MTATRKERLKKNVAELKTEQMAMEASRPVKTSAVAGDAKVHAELDFDPLLSPKAREDLESFAKMGFEYEALPLTPHRTLIPAFWGGHRRRDRGPRAAPGGCY